jgi:hypothetical protein
MNKIMQHRISVFLQVTLIIALAWAIWNANFTVAFLTALNLWISFLPTIISHNTKIHIPVPYALALNLFVYAAIFLGGVINLNDTVWWWDDMQHTLSGVTLGFIGFLTMYTLYERHKVNMGPFFLALFSFIFAVALGTLWEILEFTLDHTVGSGLQAGGLWDTMWDLIVDSIGALFTATIGYFQFKSKKRGLLQYLLDEFFNLNEHLFGK